jgi:protein N-terminal amidase
VNVGCVQFDPKLGDAAGNRHRVDALLHLYRIEAGDVDLLVLPEMAFSGYCFSSREEIEPHCEAAEHGATADWCRAAARRLGCVVACGFPERAADRLYNSMLVVDPQGAIVHVHRKHLLYVTDEIWAAEGDGFTCRQVGGLGRCAFAICMDLNPKQFKAPFDRYEFASSLFAPPLQRGEEYHADKHQLLANLAIVCNNWLRPAADRKLAEDARQTMLLNYWAARMKPVLDLPVVLVIANRVGLERQTQFAGTSCVIDLHRRAILGNLDGDEEAVLVVRDVPSYGCQFAHGRT